MNKRQYNNVIDNTLKYELSAQTDDSLATARAIFNNMGIALPQGDIKTVYDTIKTDNYMGWRSCTIEEAKKAADNGIATIGINEEKIVVVSATDEEDPVSQTSSVTLLSENAPNHQADVLRYYSYSCGTTTGNYFENDSLTVKVGWTGYNNFYGCDLSSIHWVSSDPTIADVDYESGIVQAKRCGIATIYVHNNLCTCIAAYNITVESRFCHIEQSKIMTWLVNEGGVASYDVTYSLTYEITESYDNFIKIGKISAFIKTTENPFALLTPDLSVGRTEINGEDIQLINYDNVIVSPDWIWDCKEVQLNRIYEKNSVLRSYGIAMTADSPYGYRDIVIETTLS